MNEIEKGQLAITAVQCFTEATGCLSDFPGLLKRVIEERVWERRIHHGREIILPNLRALITEKPIRGWGQDVEKVRALLHKHDPEIEELFREHLKGSPGAPLGNTNAARDKEPKQSGDNVTKLNGAKERSDGQRVTGNSRAYSIDRVTREAPQFAEAVMKGEMSPNAALVAAGIRKPRQVYLPTDPDKAAKKLRDQFGDDFCKLLATALSE